MERDAEEVAEETQEVQEVQGTQPPVIVTPGMSHTAMNAATNTSKFLLTVNNVYARSLTENSPRIQTPTGIKLPLRPHQAALVHRMYEMEKSLREGYSVTQGEKYFSRYALLGDAVGSGKSLVILSYIAHIKASAAGPPSRANPPYYHPASTAMTFSFVEVNTRPGTHMNNLLVVPHTLYRQWMEYCTRHTSLNVFFCKTRRCLADPAKVKEQVHAADLTLVSNNLYGDLQQIAEEKGIAWERCFIDEVDTIYFPMTRQPINARFTWFITATWLPVFRQHIYMSSYILQDFLTAADATSTPIHADFRRILQNCLRQEVPLTGSWSSARFFSQYLSTHPHRIYNIIRTSDAFREQSMSSPPIYFTDIRCRAHRHIGIVSPLVSPNIQMALNAGDTETVIKELGISSSSVPNLINAITSMQQKELHRLEQTLEFKRSIEYSTQQAKDAAIAALEEKIGVVKGQIEDLRKRVQDNNLCYICFEDVAGKEMAVPCCHNVFCAACILKCLSYKPACPFCREEIRPSELCYLGAAAESTKPAAAAPEPVQLTKMERLIALLKENPNGQFIVFSRYDNPFVSMQRQLEENNIRVAILTGNMDHIAKTIDSFRAGQVRVIMLNSQYYCAGMNLETASHIVLYHAGITYTEEEQIIGRAYRMGRTAPLNVVRLLHDGE